MEIVELRAFVAASRTGTVLGAANALHLTPAPVSRAIKRLEQKLGDDLFHRDYHRLVLTDTGVRALPHAVATLAQMRALAVAAAGERPLLRLGVSRWAPERFVSRFTGSSAEAGRITDADTTDPLRAPSSTLIRDLVHGELDLVLVHESQTAPGLHTHILAEYEPTFFVTVSHPLAARGTVRMAELAGRPLAIPAEFHHRLTLGGVLDQLRAAGISRIIDLPHGEMGALAHAVEEHHAVTIGNIAEETPMLRLTQEHGLIPLTVTGEVPRLSLALAWRELADVDGSTLRIAIAALTRVGRGRPEVLR